ncbi:hypothetical protein [Aeromonas allosaccharophila]|uniref:DUF2607 domain-containing protein n=1 Tax=Aeromonas allosaccharophila TaxID=656 RepID=A0AAX3NVL8_9GAMM|nr:hypothetical protein [Aeromonas allosaccharophila]WED77476.1 hypothetical protein PYU98_04285 [Aeromonas allosaccharophila]
MGHIKLKIWILLLGWLLLQPALAWHQFESALPDHDDHHCLVCALHLDGKQAIPPTPYSFPSKTAALPIVASMQQSADTAAIHTYAIRAPPFSAFLYPFV